MKKAKSFGISLAIFIALSFNGCSESSDSESNTEYIDTSNITDEIMVTAKAISDVEINENTTIDEFYQSIRYIDNIKATKNDETVLVEFGEVKIIFDNQNIEYDDTSSNESRSLRNNNKNLRGFNEITCDNSEKNAIFLSPFDWENSYEYGGDKYNNDVRNKLEDKGYCVDTITNESKRINRISYELFKNLNKYDFVYIDTHSNELGHLTLNNILSSNLEDIILKLKNNEIKLKKGEVINARPNLWNKLTIGYDTGGYNYYEAIGVEFFNTLDFKTKNTLFFIHGCNTLKIQPSSPIAQSIIKNNGKGVIGFKTYSSASWTDRLLKEYISNFTLEDSKINKSIEDTISNLENSVNIDGLMAWIGDIKTLHFQANDESELQGESGDPRINLNWSGSADLDISVTDPCGNTIYYGDREKTCGGYTGKLDIDANADIFPDDPQENIAWTNGGMPGDYKIHLSNLDSSNVSYVITIINNGETTTKTGVINGNEEKDIITITH